MKTNELRVGINVGQGLSLFFTEGFEIFVGGVGEDDFEDCLTIFIGFVG